MIGFTIGTPEGTRKVQSPSGWNEITVNQLIRLEKEFNGVDMIKCFSILTGIDYEVSEELTDPNIGETLYQVCHGIITKSAPDWGNLDCPKKILWDGELITVPTNLRNETLAQKMMMDRVLQSNDLVVEVIGKAAAIYLHPLITKSKVDNETMEKVAVQMGERNALEVYSIANFFFRKLKLYQTNMLRSLLLKNKTQLKKLRMLPNSESSKV